MNIQVYFLVWSPCSPRDSQESSPTVQKHQFFSAQLSLWSNSHIHTWIFAVQGTHSSKASILHHSAFLWSNSYIHTWLLEKTITLTRQTFVSQVMSLLFNTLFRPVITFVSRSKHLIVSWLQSPSTVILEPKKIKFATVSTFPPSICHEVMGLDAMILVFWVKKSWVRVPIWVIRFQEDSTGPYVTHSSPNFITVIGKAICTGLSREETNLSHLLDRRWFCKLEQGSHGKLRALPPIGTGS